MSLHRQSRKYLSLPQVRHLSRPRAGRFAHLGLEKLENRLVPADVTVESIGVTMDTATDTDNDYTRINKAVQMAADGDTITLVGTFDWTEPFAAQDWEAGSDGVVDGALVPSFDDYAILLPPQNNVTVTANTLGDATILGPGEQDGFGYEGAFLAYSSDGSNQNWEFSNIQFEGIEWPIAYIADGGPLDAFSGTRIVNNHISLPADSAVGVADADEQDFQNVAIHLSFGVNQTVQGNTIEFQGDGISDFANGLLASSIGFLSNTGVGGIGYDGLLIDDNLLQVVNPPNSTNDPERIVGIWENAHNHLSNITVSNNSFTNLDPANDPALNSQRAFRITSHSSPTSSITYSNNMVDGAEIGFQWLEQFFGTPQDFSGLSPVNLIGNDLTNVETGIRVGANGSAELTGNTLHNTGVSLGTGTGVVVSGQFGSGQVTILGDVAPRNTIDGFAVAVEVQADTAATVTGTVEIVNSGTREFSVQGNLNGAGTANSTVVIEDGGTINPGQPDPLVPGILNTGDLIFEAGSTYTLEVGGTSPGNNPSNHDQIQVTGAVNLGAGVATLNPVSFGGFQPGTNNTFIVISNDGVDPVIGTFQGLPEGAVLSNDFLGGGLMATITYQGGDGNDVAIETTGALRFDFNAVGSPTDVANGYIGVLPNKVFPSSPTPGDFGWEVPVAGFNRNNNDPLLRDGHYAGPPHTPRTFQVALDPALTYQVTVHMGDLAFPRGPMELNVMGGTNNPSFTNIVNQAGEIQTFMFEFTPDSAGQLGIEFRTLPGADPHWVVNAIDIRPLAPVSALGDLPITRIDPAPSADPLLADGITIDTYEGIGAPPDGFLTLTASIGSITEVWDPTTGNFLNDLTDATTVHPGIQVQADANGVFRFQVLRPTGIGPAEFTATEFSGLSQGTFSQEYILPDVRRIDFAAPPAPGVPQGPPGSPLASTDPAFLGLLPVTYESVEANALGWDAPGVASFDRGGPELLLRDGHYAGVPGASRTLRFNVPDAGVDYQLTLHLGDLDFAREIMSITAQPGTAFEMTVTDISTAAGEVAVVSFIVTPTDLVRADGIGEIVLQFSVSGGKHFVVNGLDVRPNIPDPTSTVGVAPITLMRIDATTGMELSGPVEADGVTRDTYQGTGLTPGALVTVSASGGELMVADASALYQGIQLMADGSGTITFDLLRPNGTADVILSTVEVTGLARSLVPFVQQYQVASNRSFDFNGPTNITATSTVGVRGNQTVTEADLPSVGFGWNSPVTEFTRSGSNALLRGGHYGTSSTPNTFLIQVDPGGTYDVTAHIGDNNFARDQIQVTFFDGLGGNMLGQYTVDALSPGMFDDTTTTVSPTGGVLAITFEDLGGDIYWVVNGIDIATGATQLAQGGAILDPVGVEPLTDEQLAPLAQEAIARWLLTDLSIDQQAQLQSVHFHIRDLSDAVLGRAPLGGSVVYVDATAAGHGWFLDPTPQQDEEYSFAFDSVEGLASADLASEGVDLLSVLMHELGHIIGYADIPVSEDAHHLMTASIGIGTRRVPEPQNSTSASLLDGVFSSGFESEVDETDNSATTTPIDLVVSAPPTSLLGGSDSADWSEILNALAREED